LYGKTQVCFIFVIAIILTSRRAVQAWIVRWLWIRSRPPNKLQGTLGQRVCSDWAVKRDFSCLLPSQSSDSQLIWDISGNLDLPRMFPFLGTQELQVLSVLASFFLMAVQCITCFFVKEKVLVSVMCVPFIFRIGRHADKSAQQ
jgi:hypothetical protein